mmetsp:Transcript_13537/g.25505  ORF Transcript_13537/g.25505 Transcript_13537/m.25505 type:complete len:233 (-) Transcript_13537:1328-2026(-)
MSPSKLLLIRHAQSLANRASQELYEAGGNAQSVRWDLDMVDCPITELGVEQSTALAESLKEVHVDTVIVSPIYRALQTCEIAFKDHPSSPKVLVHPLIYESLCCSADLSSLFSLPHPEFSHYDWSLMPESDYWQFTVADNKIIRKIKKRFSRDSWHAEAVRQIQLTERKLLESAQQFTDRANRFKAFLQDLPGVVAIVSHAGFLREFTKTEEMERGIYFRNCELIDGTALLP